MNQYQKEYCDTKGTKEFNKYNNNDYTKFLEKKLNSLQTLCIESNKNTDTDLTLIGDNLYEVKKYSKDDLSTCDVCGSENTIGAPHMGSNCLDCNPI